MTLLSARRAPGPLRIVQVVDSFERGGAQVVALQLSSWLVDHGCRVAISGRDGPLAHGWFSSVEVEVRPRMRIVGDLVALLRLSRRFRPDLLHAHQRREALLCLMVGALLGIPVVEHAHTVLPSRSWGVLSFRSRRVFAVSDGVRRMVSHGFGRPADRVVRVGNAVAVSASRSRTGSKPIVPWSPPVARALRVVGIGRLVEQKDPLRFVRIVAAAAEIDRVEAVWLGDGPLRDDATRLARSLGAPVEFRGAVADVTPVLDECDALLLVSRWEGLPLVLLETFDRERPVVATEASADAETLAGRAVVVPDAASDAEAARLLLSLVAEPAVVRERLAAGRRLVDVDAHPDVVFGRVLETYVELTGASR